MMKRPLLLVLLCSFLQSSCNHKSGQQGDQDGLIRAGDRVNQAGDSTSAINVYKSALEKNPPQKLPLYLKLGEAYMNAERLEEAKKTYEEALPYDENDEVKKQLGRLYIATGQPDTAISMFEGILLVHKDDGKALNGLGVAYDIKGDHQRAQDLYRKSLIINGDNDQVKSNLGLSLAFSGKYDEALKLLQPLGEAVGATSKHRHNLALVYGLSGNKAKAQEIYGKDMDAREIQENLHALNMTVKPQTMKNETMESIAMDEGATVE
ncbi:MAG: tetratricopeptide repeat protein [Alphaproteobacteria bacterium]|nr:tetratricopeptide repeat protein [Alphaproteobacteria bacterium]